MPSLFLKRIK